MNTALVLNQYGCSVRESPAPCAEVNGRHHHDAATSEAPLSTKDVMWPGGITEPVWTSDACREKHRFYSRQTRINTACNAEGLESNKEPALVR